MTDSDSSRYFKLADIGGVLAGASHDFVLRVAAALVDLLTCP